MSSTPRVAPVTDLTPEQAELLSKTLITPDSDPLNLFATLAHHPRLLKRANALGGLFMAHGTLDPRDREIVILRVATRVESAYEWAQHEVIGRRCGLGPEEIARVREESLDGWSPADAVLLAATDELCDRDDLTDEAWTALSSRGTTEQTLELIMMVGFYRMLGGLLRTLRVQIDASVTT